MLGHVEGWFPKGLEVLESLSHGGRDGCTPSAQAPQFDPDLFLCQLVSFLHTKTPKFLCSPVGFITLGSPNLYPNHPPRLTAHTCTRHGHTYLQDAQSGGLAFTHFARAKFEHFEPWILRF